MSTPNPASDSFDSFKYKTAVEQHVPHFFRMRLAVVPMLAIFATIIWLDRDEPWKLAVILLLMGILGAYFLIEFLVARREKLSADRLCINFMVIALGQCTVIYLTGGTASPILPVLIVPGIVAALIFEKQRYIVAIQATYASCIVTLICNDIWRLFPQSHIRAFNLSEIALQYPVYHWTAVGLIVILSMLLPLLARAANHVANTYFEELVQAREDLIHTQRDRLRELETISSHIAHEIKNPLVSIKGLTQLMSRKLSDGATKDRERFEVMQTEIERIEEILASFATFSKPLDRLNLEQVDLNTLLRQCLTLYEMHFDRNKIRVLHDDIPQSPLIAADPRKLKQILINLIQNAVEAMPSGGTLALHARQEETNVLISLSDTGTGISQERLDRLFEPYFTTKTEGTGLGLTIARGIARQHGGDLQAESTPGGGATFRIQLPIAAPAEIDPKRPPGGQSPNPGDSEPA